MQIIIKKIITSASVTSEKGTLSIVHLHVPTRTKKKIKREGTQKIKGYPNDRIKRIFFKNESGFVFLHLSIFFFH